MQFERLIPAAKILTVLLATFFLTGCNFHYARGVSLEQQNRWEEAAIEYHLALVEDPGVEEYEASLARANRVVAKENLELYRVYLARKEFGKAYQRLEDAIRQDPALVEAANESKRWLRVLVAGQVEFEFDQLRANLNLADEIRLVMRINTPNPGEIIESEIDLGTGTVYAENLLYDRPNEMLAYYSLNSVGVNMTYGRGKRRKYTTNEFLRFINFRTPVLDELKGTIRLGQNGQRTTIATHRSSLAEPQHDANYWTPRRVPHYSLKLQGRSIHVTAKDNPSTFTPRYLYVNSEDRRIFVDFGRYEIRGDREGKWGARRLPISGQDYFPDFSTNIALQPYFFYREGVFSFLPDGNG